MECETKNSSDVSWKNHTKKDVPQPDPPSPTSSKVSLENYGTFGKDTLVL